MENNIVFAATVYLLVQSGGIAHAQNHGFEDVGFSSDFFGLWEVNAENHSCWDHEYFDGHKHLGFDQVYVTFWSGHFEFIAAEWVMMRGTFNESSGEFSGKGENRMHGDGVVVDGITTCAVTGMVTGTYYGWDNETQTGIGPGGVAWEAHIHYSYNFACRACDDTGFYVNSTLRIGDPIPEIENKEFELPVPDRLDGLFTEWDILPAQEASCQGLVFAFDSVDISYAHFPRIKMMPLTSYGKLSLRGHFDLDSNTFSLENAYAVPLLDPDCGLKVDAVGSVLWDNSTLAEEYNTTLQWNATVKLQWFGPCGCRDTELSFHTKRTPVIIAPPKPLDLPSDLDSSSTGSGVFPGTTGEVSPQTVNGEDAELLGIPLWAAILLIVVLGLLLLAVAAVVPWWLTRRRKSDDDEDKAVGIPAADLPAVEDSKEDEALVDDIIDENNIHIKYDTMRSQPPPLSANESGIHII